MRTKLLTAGIAAMSLPTHDRLSWHANIIAPALGSSGRCIEARLSTKFYVGRKHK